MCYLFISVFSGIQKALCRLFILCKILTYLCRCLLYNYNWRRKWQPTAVFLLGESLWTEEPRKLQSMGLQESDTTERSAHTHTHRIINTYKQRSLYQLNQRMENTYWVREQRRPQQPEAPSSLWDYIGGQYVLLINEASRQQSIMKPANLNWK